MKCLLNNISMGSCRKDPTYQAALIDLANAGAIPKDTAEKLLGYSIPAYIKLPATFTSVEKKEEKKKDA